MKLLNPKLDRRVGILMLILGSLQWGGCCPYSQGLIVDMSSQTQSSAINSLDYAESYLKNRGYRIWQRDEQSGYIRGSIERDSSLGYRVEDVLAVSVQSKGDGTRFEVSAETYRLGSRREKAKVSKEAKADASTLKDGLSRYNPSSGDN